MNKKGFSEKDILKWITIAAAIILGYIIINALLTRT
jgi:imidazolonepropionase-like amidohydrolase